MPSWQTKGYVPDSDCSFDAETSDEQGQEDCRLRSRSLKPTLSIQSPTSGLKPTAAIGAHGGLDIRPEQVDSPYRQRGSNLASSSQNLVSYGDIDELHQDLPQFAPRSLSWPESGYEIEENSKRRDSAFNDAGDSGAPRFASATLMAADTSSNVAGLTENGSVSEGKDRGRQESTSASNVPETDTPSLNLRLCSGAHQRPRRNLRTRNIIQLHPYSVEGQRYRDALKSRGLKPVLIAAQPPASETSSRTSESSDLEIPSEAIMFERFKRAISSSRTSPTTHRSSISILSENPTPASKIGFDDDTIIRNGDYDEDLPDLDILLRTKKAAFIRKGPKRRKLNQRYLNMKPSTAPSAIRYHDDSPKRHLCEDFTLGRSSNLPTLDVEPVFKRPPGLSPSQLRTPTMVEIRESNRDRSEVHSGNWDGQEHSWAEDKRARPVFIPGSAEVVSVSSQEGVETESDDQSQLKRAQKRIKGVLPASWLKLDHSSDERTSIRRSRRSGHPDVPPGLAPQRGVAMKLSRRGASRNGTECSPINIFDIIDSSGDTAVDHSPVSSPGMPKARKSKGQSLAAIERTGGRVTLRAKEDERICQQLKQATCGDTDHRPIRDPQMRTENERFRSDKPPTKIKSWSNSQPRKLKRQTNFEEFNRESSGLAKARREKAVHYLSIIDVTEESGDSGARPPPFIRLASRAARRRRDRGRQSPGGKIIRLPTHKETVEANAVLEDWKCGKVRKSSSAVNQAIPLVKSRAPLQDRPVNARRTRSAFLSKTTINELTSDGNSPLRNHTLAHSQPRSKFRQTKFNVIVRPKNTLRPYVPRIEESKDYLDVGTLEGRAWTTQSLYINVKSDTGVEALNGTDHPKGASTLKRFEDSLVPTKSSNAASKGKQQLMDITANGGSGQETPTEIRCHPKELVSLAKLRRPSSPRKPWRKKNYAPKRLDIEVQEFRQPNESTTSYQDRSTLFSFQNCDSEDVLTGLYPYGCPYAVTFDVQPLERGAFFHESTFLGSGDFLRSLHPEVRGFSTSSRPCLFRYGSITYRWSAWTEDVASALDCLSHSFVSQIRTLQSTQRRGSEAMDLPCCAALRGVIQYCSESLSFNDPADHMSFMANAIDFLQNTFKSVVVCLESFGDVSPASHSNIKTFVPILAYILTFAVQVLQIARSEDFEAASSFELEHLVRTSSGALFKALLIGSLEGLKHCLEQNRGRLHREAGIRGSMSDAEALVILHHAMNVASLPKAQFWDIAYEQLSQRVAGTTSLQHLEHVWHAIFVFVPFLEFDPSGFLCVGQRFKTTTDGWSLVKGLMGRLFELYPRTAKTQMSTLNAYVRSCLSRCHHLINTWAWWRCEVILVVIFDFFGQNGLAQLRHEECHGSPTFLENLCGMPALDIQAEDRAFHIFLKSLASGLTAMNRIYSSKKVSGTVWRFIPNHGRTYRRDQSVRQQDLDALRNHHDLICTLYWASPSDFRPRIDLFRSLVDHSCSHREACRLNIRAWSIIAKLHISTDKAIDAPEPIGLWYKEIFEQNLLQYQSARKEAEDHYKQVNIRGMFSISRNTLVSTVRSNQAGVLATLTELVAAMQNVMAGAKNDRGVTSLLHSSAFGAVTRLFDPESPLLCKLLLEALKVYKEYATILDSFHNRTDTQSNEESQDYGEWPELDGCAESEHAISVMNKSIESVVEPLLHLRSDCFGAESMCDETLLISLVKMWTTLARSLVQRGFRDWRSYLDSYSPFSWHQLRDTKQTQKYGVLFLALVLDADATSYDGHKSTFWGSWMLSLVDQESMLEFQHLLTAALLNVDSQNPLLQNLPFLQDSESGRFEVTLPVLKERRLHLLSCVLANMRDSCDALMHVCPENLPERRSEYASLLRQVMVRMRRNYEELGQNTNLAEDYAAFVQRIVEFMQQYTADFCPIDRFFTDSAAFPLPARDPTYVVGKLRSYRLQSGDLKVYKQLAVFIQTVSERAALDNQQIYFAGQLSAAMRGAFEAGSSQQPTLRRVLTKFVFPAYVELSFRSPTGWVLALPILHAMNEMFNDLIYDFSVTDTASASAALSIVGEAIYLLSRTVGLLVDHSGLLDQAHILHLLTEIFRVVTAALISLDYIHRSLGLAQPVIRRVVFLNSFGTFVIQTITRHGEIFAPYCCEEGDDWDHTERECGGAPVATVREFCSRELNQAIRANWVKHEGGYWVTKGTVRKMVRLQTGDLKAERMRVCQAIGDFNDVLRRMPDFGFVERETLPLRSIADIVI